MVTQADGTWMDYWTDDRPYPRLGRDNISMWSDVEETGALLQATQPEYYQWTTTVFREFVPLPKELPDKHSSSSFLYGMGHLHATTPEPELETAEMFVHECSHQYYNLLLWWKTLTKPGAPDVYSVLKDTTRPLDRVFLGLHAFANVWLMHRLIEERDVAVDREQLRKRMRHNERLVSELDQIVSRYADSQLTEIGEVLYSELVQQLVSHDFPFKRAA